MRRSLKKDSIWLVFWRESFDFAAEQDLEVIFSKPGDWRYLIFLGDCINVEYATEQIMQKAKKCKVAVVISIRKQPVDETGRLVQKTDYFRVLAKY